MRKVFTLAVVALLGCESMGQSFRHHQGPLINRPTPPSTFAFDEVVDNEMAWTYSPPLTKGHATGGFDDAEDNEMVVAMGQKFPRLPPRPSALDDAEDNEMWTYRPPLTKGYATGGFDDAEDNEMAFVMGNKYNQPLINRPPRPTILLDDAEDNEMAYVVKPEPYRRPPLRSARWFDEAEDNALYRAEMIAPRAATFDDFEDDNLFALDEVEDNNLASFGNFGSTLNRPSGWSHSFSAAGGSAPGGIGWGAQGSVTRPLGNKGTTLTVGGQLSHAPGSKMGYGANVGLKIPF